MILEEVIIPPPFNGPRGLGNGGYVAGVLARHIAGDAEVRLARGFPVATPLTLTRAADGSVRCERQDEELGRARSIVLDLEIPAAPSLEEARAAGFRYRFLHRSDPRGCYVCSPLRTPDEGLQLFCGPLAQGHKNLVAAVWSPGSAWADAHGQIAPPHVWGALDCPGGYAIEALAPGAGSHMLGTCAASIRAPLAAGEAYVVSAWEIAPPAGRKRFMGVAIHSSDGRLRACASQVWIRVVPARHGE